MNVESRRNFYLERTLELKKAIEQIEKAGKEIEKQLYRYDDCDRKVNSDCKKDDIIVSLSRETWSYVLTSLAVRVCQMDIRKKIADAELAMCNESYGGRR